MKLIADRYQIIEHLGQGGMGDVYRGVDTQTQDVVAIKNLRGGINDDTQILERFRREGAILKELNHPNIVKMLDMVQEDGTNYLIMEFIDGGDLSQMLKKRGKIPFDEAIKLSLELADALSRAHHLGIVHRDIKPANVLIAPDGTPRLTDFGVARIEAAERMTGTGMSVGTLDYMPPEAINGEPVDASGDIWGFGVMLYEIITGERPFTGESTLILMTNILTKPAPDIRDRAPDAPQDLQDLIQQMLEKDPQFRLRSARQLGAALEALSRGAPVNLQRLDTPRITPVKTATALDVPPETLPLNDSMTPETPSKRRFPVGVPVLAVLLVTIIGVFLVASSALNKPDTPASTPASGDGAVSDIVADASAEATDEVQSVMTTAEPAPEGYEWMTMDELSLLVPSGWTELNMDGLITMVRNSLTSESDFARLDSGINFWEQQREGVSYMNWLNLEGIAIFIEDTGLALTDETQDERIRELGRLAEFNSMEETEPVELSSGQARHYVAEMDVNNVTMNLNLYLLQQNATQYIFLFGGRIDRTTSLQTVADVVLPSVRIGNPIQAETTSEPITLSLPEDWKVVNGEGYTFGIPSNWATLPPNMDLVRSSLELTIPGENVDRVLAGLGPFNVSLLFGTFNLESSVTGSVLTLLSSELSMDYVVSYFETLQQVMYEGVRLENFSQETLSLPAGTARQTMSRIIDDEGRSTYMGRFTIIETPQEFYIISMILPESGYEAWESTLNQILESFAVTPSEDQ